MFTMVKDENKQISVFGDKYTSVENRKSNRICPMHAHTYVKYKQNNVTEWNRMKGKKREIE